MCKLPAVELLQMRREAALGADSANNLEAVRSAMNFVKAVDDLRLAHEELTGCDCWYRAVEATR